MVEGCDGQLLRDGDGSESRRMMRSALNGSMRVRTRACVRVNHRQGAVMMMMMMMIGEVTVMD